MHLLCVCRLLETITQTRAHILFLRFNKDIDILPRKCHAFTRQRVPWRNRHSGRCDLTIICSISNAIRHLCMMWPIFIFGRTKQRRRFVISRHFLLSPENKSTCLHVETQIPQMISKNREFIFIYIGFKANGLDYNYVRVIFSLLSMSAAKSLVHALVASR